MEHRPPVDVIDRVPEELRTEVHDIVQEAGIKTIPKKTKCIITLHPHHNKFVERINYMSGELCAPCQRPPPVAPTLLPVPAQSQVEGSPGPGG